MYLIVRFDNPGKYALVSTLNSQILESADNGDIDIISFGTEKPELFSHGDWYEIEEK